MFHADQQDAGQYARVNNDVPGGRFTRFVRRGIRFAIIAVFVVAIAVWAIYVAAQKEPDFYQAALAVKEQDQVEQGSLFEKRVLEFQNDVRTRPQWQAVFTEGQINGWLARDFPEKFPGTLPPSVRDPRIGIHQDELRIAFRFHSNSLKGIVQARVDTFCTEVPGQVAIRIKRVGSGLIPIPVNTIADHVSTALRRLGARVEWTEIDRDPVVLIELPPDTIKIGNKRILLDSIQLLDKELVLTGESFELE